MVHSESAHVVEECSVVVYDVPPCPDTAARDLRRGQILPVGQVVDKRSEPVIVVITVISAFVTQISQIERVDGIQQSSRIGAADNDHTAIIVIR